MTIRNTAARWGTPSKLLHWVAAALILLLILHGAWMTDFAPRESRVAHYSGHASLGYALLALMVVRLLWRWMNEVPELPAGTLAWERISAFVAHWGLYALIFAASITGWALAGTFRQPLDATLLGFIPVPPIVHGPDRMLHDVFESSHKILSWTLAALILVHIGGAIYHAAVRRDDVLRRMLPGKGGPA